MRTSTRCGPGSPWVNRSTVSVGMPGTTLNDPKASGTPSTRSCKGRPSTPSRASCPIRTCNSASRLGRANGVSNHTESTHKLGEGLAWTGSRCQDTVVSGDVMASTSWLLSCTSLIQKARFEADSARPNWSMDRSITASSPGLCEESWIEAMRSRASGWVKNRWSWP